MFLGKARRKLLDLPVLTCIKENNKATCYNVTVIYVPSLDVTASKSEAIDVEIEPIVHITESIPQEHMVKVKQNKSCFIGSNWHNWNSAQ